MGLQHPLPPCGIYIYISLSLSLSLSTGGHPCGGTGQYNSTKPKSPVLQHSVRHNRVLSSGDFLVADCSSSPLCAMSNARCGRQSGWVLLVAGNDEGRSHIRMLCEELLLGEPYIIAGAPLARSGKIGFCTFPPLCAGVLWPMPAWVWRDVKSHFFSPFSSCESRSEKLTRYWKLGRP